MSAGLHLIASDLAGCAVVAGQQDRPWFLRRLEHELVAGVEVLLAKHAAFRQWLVDHGDEAS